MGLNPDILVPKLKGAEEVQGTSGDRQSSSDVNTKRNLSYIITFLFFALIFVLIFHGSGSRDVIASEDGPPRMGGQSLAVTIGGTSAEGDVLQLAFSELPSSEKAIIEYTVSKDETLTTIAEGLKSKIDKNDILKKYGVVTTVSGQQLNISFPQKSTTVPSLSATIAGVAKTETIAVSNKATIPASPVALVSTDTAKATGIGTSRDLLFTLFGVVATGWTTIIGYYFGSSAGSAQKSQTIAQALDQKNNPTTQESSASSLPKLQLIKPNPLSRNTLPQDINLQGLNLLSIKSVQLVSSSGKSITTNIKSSSAALITCEVLIDLTFPDGDWEIRLFDGSNGTGVMTSFPRMLHVLQ